MSRKSESKSILGTQKGIKSIFISLKNWNWKTFPCRKILTNVIIFDLRRSKVSTGFFSVLVHTWFDWSYSLPNTLHNTSCFMPKNYWKRLNQCTSYHMVIGAADPSGHDLIHRKTRIFLHLTMSGHMQKWNDTLCLDKPLASLQNPICTQ